MRNMIADGHTKTVTATAAVASGDFNLLGSNIFGCAINAAGIGAKVTYVTESKVYENAPKATGAAWVAGDLLYWDNTAKNFTKTANANTKVGVAWEDADAGAAVGIVKVGPSIG